MWAEVHTPGGMVGWLFWEGGGGWRGLGGEPPPVQGLAVVAGMLRQTIGDSGCGVGDTSRWMERRAVPRRSGNDGSASHPRAATASPRLLVAAFGCYGDDPMMLDPEVAKRYHWV